MEDFFTNSNIGLIFDMLGVLVLGGSLIMMTPDAIKISAGTSWGHLSPKIIESVGLRYDNILGILFLFVGFLFQIFGNKVSIPPCVSITLLLIALTCTFSYCMYFRKKICDWWEEKYLKGETIEGLAAKAMKSDIK